GHSECVIALAETDGHELWVAEIGPAREIGERGPRSTPTVDGDCAYAVGVGGDLVCLSVAGGAGKWRRDPAKEVGGPGGPWGYSESPLIDGDKVICTPGGPSAALVALDKMTGRTIWQATVPGGDRAEYSSCVVADCQGRRMYVQFLGGGVVGVAAEDGKFL